MWQQIFLCLLGLCSGAVIAAGIVGLLIGLSIVPRYAGITHTSEHITLYEDVTLLGTTLGNIYFLFRFPIPLGTPFLIICGLFFGIFLGGWIMALAEMADIFPVFLRRIKLREGLSLIIFVLALGKAAGSLYFYWKGWF